MSFGAMKKSQFDGIDYAVVEKFKAPIEKYNSNADFQIWAIPMILDIKNGDYTGRTPETTLNRHKIISEWGDNIINYNPATQLLILNSITKNLKKKEDKLPPEYNEKALEKTVNCLKSVLKSNPNYQFDFLKLYNKELKSSYISADYCPDNYTGWIVIQSKSHDKAHYGENVSKLKALSAERWCTRNNHADYYLNDGDFHIYVEDGCPRVALRFVGKKLVEIQGELNDNYIPQYYYDEIQKYIADNGFKVFATVQKELNFVEERKIILDKAKKDLKKAIKEDDVETILSYFNMKFKKDADGFLIMEDGYFQPSGGLTWKDLGVNEDTLLNRIRQINGYCDMAHSTATNLGEVKVINGYLRLANSYIKELGKLEVVGDVDFSDSKIKHLGSLREIKGNAVFSRSSVETLDNLESIGGNALFSNSKVKSLANLRKIGGDAILDISEIEDTGMLEYIGKNADFVATKMKTLGKLRTIGGNARFNNSKLESTGDLDYIGGYADFCKSKIRDFANLREIKQDLILKNTPLESLGNLEIVGGKLRLTETNITDLGNLRIIGGDAVFSNSEVTTLKNLESIGGNAKFSDSAVNDLGALREIIGDADFTDSNIRNYKDLMYIRGNARFNVDNVPNAYSVQVSGDIIVVSPKDDGLLSSGKNMLKHFPKIFGF
ncbi:hypothetical protein IKP85_03310 [bacterium]|nr:hypothetical protein [bacterium]